MASLFRPEALQHQQQAWLGGIQLIRPLSLTLLTVFMLACAVAVVAFLSVGQYTQKARVNGYLVPEGGLIGLRPAVGGTVVRRLVTEGQLVRKGEALRIHALNPARGSLLISLNDIFMTDFAQLRSGTFDPNRSTWHRIKAFPKNIELQVAATYSGSRWYDDDSIIDDRGSTVVPHDLELDGSAAGKHRLFDAEADDPPAMDLTAHRGASSTGCPGRTQRAGALRDAVAAR